eukprot:2136591-Rhodomonas_salina.1
MYWHSVRYCLCLAGACCARPGTEAGRKCTGGSGWYAVPGTEAGYICTSESGRTLKITSVIPSTQLAALLQVRRVCAPRAPCTRSHTLALHIHTRAHTHTQHARTAHAQRRTAHAQCSTINTFPCSPKSVAAACSRGLVGVPLLVDTWEGVGARRWAEIDRRRGWTWRGAGSATREQSI